MQLEPNGLGSLDHGVAIGEAIHFPLYVAGLLDSLDRSRGVLSDLVAQGVELYSNLSAELVVLLEGEEALSGAGKKGGGSCGAQERAASHTWIGA